MGPRVGVAIFGCLTVKKYRQQIEDAFATWVQDALEAGWIVRFYTDKIPSDIHPELNAICVNLNLGDSYMSATWKQWRGLEHMRIHCEPCDLYFTAGTDTFLNVRNMRTFYKRLDTTRALYIGGGKGRENIQGVVYSYFSGGGGVTVTGPALDLILESVPELVIWWIGTVTNATGLLGACDLQFGCILANLPQIEWVQNLEFHGDGPHTVEAVNKDTACTVHLMQHDDFYDYYSYIHKGGVSASDAASLK